MMKDKTVAALEAFVHSAAEDGCIKYSTVDQFAQRHGLEDEDDLDQVYELIQSRGIELSDDCGRETRRHRVLQRGPDAAPRSTPSTCS